VSTPWSDAIKSSLKRPGFLVVSLVLLLGAVGINAATSAMKLHFRKEALPLRSKEGLAAFPLQVGNWVCMPETHTVDADLQHELHTDQYVFRTYVDTSPQADGKPIATREQVLDLAKKTRDEQFQELQKYRAKNEAAVINLAVTYYTGKVDTVPHVPDRCYVADGFQPSVYEKKDWVLGEYEKGRNRAVPVRFIDFQDLTNRGSQNRCVTYFFHANGKYMDDPNQVRIALQNLFAKYGYFAKIEVMTLLPNRPGAMANDPLKDKDRKSAAGAMQRFLTAALPEVEKLLPDKAVFEGK
jgi:hypothetical protein